MRRPKRGEKAEQEERGVAKEKSYSMEKRRQTGDISYTHGGSLRKEEKGKSKEEKLLTIGYSGVSNL